MKGEGELKVAEGLAESSSLLHYIAILNLK